MEEWYCSPPKETNDGLRRLRGTITHSSKKCLNTLFIEIFHPDLLDCRLDYSLPPATKFRSKNEICTVMYRFRVRKWTWSNPKTNFFCQLQNAQARLILVFNNIQNVQKIYSGVFFVSNYQDKKLNLWPIAILGRFVVRSFENQSNFIDFSWFKWIMI